MAMKNGPDGVGGQFGSLSLPGGMTSIVLAAPILAKHVTIPSSNSKRLEDIADLLLPNPFLLLLL
ncbi:hypothetical protein [Phyllobacterium chamaecytisi]|uniref:hypothetical protein n=1 Tax=Phyllobacterium chamaecytisi TaxID=2876082 RepID=UPI001CCD867F|nr:hypothetical protein [Phyllobacterium sp. KW56]MBZ9600564.1 hypothetical protein [Phyllobacterium sp. KW56]